MIALCFFFPLRLTGKERFIQLQLTEILHPSYEKKKKKYFDISMQTYIQKGK